MKGFEVAKQGWLSGPLGTCWGLPDESGSDRVLASGVKPSLFTRSFDLTIGSEENTCLQARSALGRTFELVQGERRLISEIAPDHPFTRRSSIKTFDDEIPFVIHAFTFWLVGVIWKRQQRNSNAS